jgi:hypothetical protein
MRHTCDYCGEWKKLEPLEDTINRQTYYICDDCNEEIYDNEIENRES